MLKMLNKLIIALHTFLLLGMSFIMMSRSQIEELSQSLFPNSKLLMNSLLVDSVITYYGLFIPLTLLLSYFSFTNKN